MASPPHPPYSPVQTAPSPDQPTLSNMEESGIEEQTLEFPDEEPIPEPLDEDTADYSENSGDTRYNNDRIIGQEQIELNDELEALYPNRINGGQAIYWWDLAESIINLNNNIHLVEGLEGDVDNDGDIYIINRVNEAERAIELFKQQFPHEDTPNRYTYRDTHLKQLITKPISYNQFKRNPWPNPYVRPIRSLGSKRKHKSKLFYNRDDELVQYELYGTVYRSRPNYYIYCADIDIPWCGNTLPVSTFKSPMSCFEIIDFAIDQLLKKEITIAELQNTSKTISIWFQVTVIRQENTDPKKLSEIVLTTEILSIPYEENLFITASCLYLASWISWRFEVHHNQDYWELIDDDILFGHTSNIKMFIVRNPPTQEELKTIKDQRKEWDKQLDNTESSESDNSELAAGCKGYFGNKYISHRLTRYVIDPQSTYNNCLFFCIYHALKEDVNDERALQHRIELEIPAGSKIKVSELDKISNFFNITIVLYRIYKEFNGQKYFDVHGYYGNPANKNVSILLSSSHFCLIKNPKKLTEFKSCPSCYDWFNSKTKRGQQHFEKCQRCEKCGVKVTKQHKCRDQPKKRKFVRFENPKKRTFSGLENMYVADFETFMYNGEMVVYAAGLASVADIDKDPKLADIQLWYGPDALEKFCQYLLDIDEKITVVFYNGSRFDFWFMLRWALSKRITIENFVREGKSNKMMNLEYSNIKLWDLCLFTLTSLKQLCVDFNLPSEFRKGDFDHKKIKSWNDVMLHAEEVKDYLFYDVLCLGICQATFVQKFWQLYKKDPMQCVTLSHVAYDVWRNYYIEPEYLSMVKIPTEAEWKFFNAGNFGGRCMCYRKGFKSRYYQPYRFLKLLSAESQTQLFNITTDYLRYKDIVSLYPYVSRDDMPFGTPRFMEDVSVIERIIQKPHLNSSEVNIIQRSFIKVDVTCPKNIMIAFLLARGKKGELLCDLNDKTEQIYDGFTILEALKLGYEFTKVHEWLCFPRLGPLLASYMNECITNKAKHTKKEAEYHIHKGMANNLTGKFNQKPITTDQHFFYDDGFFKDKELSDITKVEWMQNEKKEHLAYYVETRKDPEEINRKPDYMGGFVLSRSKSLMSEYTREIDGYNKEDCPYYCDTDSLIIHNDTYEKHRHKPIFGDQWGQLKDELGEHCKIVAAYFVAPKTYAFEYWYLEKEGPDKGKIVSAWYIRAKGIPKGDKSCPTAKDYEKLEAMNREQPEDLKEVLYTLYDRDGFKMETKNTLPFYYFEEMMVRDRYVVAHFGSIKKYLLDEKNLGCSVKLNLDLHRTINKKRWWDNKTNKKRNMITDNLWDVSLPVGHEELS